MPTGVSLLCGTVFSVTSEKRIPGGKEYEITYNVASNEGYNSKSR